jgi:hypothetical protein
VLDLILILLVTAVTLTAVLWAGTFFFQGYIYTEPSAGIFWQAPVAAALLMIGYTIWCASIVFSAKASPANLPYDALHRFSPKEDMAELDGKPPKNIWAIKLDRRKTGPDKDGEVVPYELKRGPRGEFIYMSKVGKAHAWQPDGVIAIEIEKPDGSKQRYDLIPTEESANREFVSKDGWVITELPGAGGGPGVVPYKFRWGRWFVNLFFNFGHFVVWFLGLWVILRFQWSHALGFAVVMWLAATLIFLPLLLGYAGTASANRREAATSLLGAFASLVG